MGEINTFMLELITLLSTNIFRTFIIYRFIHLFFTPKNDKKSHEFYLYFSFILSTSLVHYFFHMPFINIINNIVMLLIISSFYNGTLLYKLLIILLIYCIAITCEIFSVYALHNYGIDKQYSDISLFLSLLIFFCFEFISESVLSKYLKHKNNYISLNCLFILILFPIISLLIILMLFINEITNRFLITSICICLLTINMLIIVLYSHLLSLFQKIQNNLLIERQSESYYNQLCILEETDKKLQSFKHDINNHMNELLSMAKKGNNSYIVRYLESMNYSISTDSEIVNSGNPCIDSILNYLLSKAYNNSCIVKCKVAVPPQITIDLFDLNVILSNLIDNAIIAASNSKLKEVSVFIRWDKNILLINIVNSYNNILKTVNNRYITTKKDAHNHGVGLENVKRIVNKYNGILQIDDQNNIFDVKAMLYI